MHGLSDTTVDLPPTGLPTAATDSTSNPKPASVSMSRSKTKTCSPWRHPIRQRSHKITNAKQGAYVTPLLHRSWDITIMVAARLRQQLTDLEFRYRRPSSLVDSADVRFVSEMWWSTGGG
jgi:hypothetical protein